MQSKHLKAYPVYLLLNFLQFCFLWMAFTVDNLYFVITAQLDPLQLVLVGTTLEAAIFLFEIPTGVVADLYSRRLSVIIGLFLTGAGFLIMGAWPVFTTILISQVVWGLGLTFISGAMQAWISDEIGEEKAANAFLRGAQMQQIGSVAGIIIGTLIGLGGYQIPILISGSLFLLLAGWMNLSMPEEGFKPTPREERSTWKNMLNTFSSGVSMVKHRPVLGRILIIGLIFGLYSEGFDRLWTAHLLERFNFPGLPTVVWFGIIAAVSYLLSALVLEVIKRRVDLSKSKNLIQTMQIASLFLVIALVIFAISKAMVLSLIIFLLITVLREINYPLYTAWANQKLDSSVRATILSLTSQVDAIGQIGGGPWVGWIARQFSLQAGLLTSAALLAPVLAFLNKNSVEE